MKTRGEKYYINMPPLAVKMYDKMTGVKGVNRGFEEIAVMIGNDLKQGKLLDIGTGPGRLLSAIQTINPYIDLFGIDISASMILIAEQNLKNISDLNLKVGNIVSTEYPDDFFDGIVSTGSFYNWDHPVEGLNEVYRILKPNCTACIFESYRDHDKKLLKARLKSNLKGYNVIRKLLTSFFLGKQLRMTYSLPEFEEILRQTSFRDSFSMIRTELGNLPVYVKLELLKE